jgi:lipopolysaccharide biosynthesis glycosyltransferase
MKKYNVAFSINKKHILYMHVVLASLIDNNKDKFFDVYLLHNDGICEKDLEYFSNILKIKNFHKNYIIHIIDMKNVKDFNTIANHSVAHWGTEVFFRLFLENIITEKHASVLILDCDTICIGDISFMYEFKSNSLMIGDGFFVNQKSKAPSRINPGASCLNLDRARELNFKDKTIDLIKRVPNTTDEGAIGELFLQDMQFVREEKLYTMSTRHKVPKNLKNVALVHFVGKKPFYMSLFFRHSVALSKIFYYYVEFFIPKNSMWKFNFMRFNSIYITRFYYSIIKGLGFKKLAKKIYKFNENVLFKIIDK